MFHPHLIQHFLATTVTKERPQLFHEVIVHPGNYYPTPSNPDYVKKRLLYETCQPILAPFGLGVDRDQREFMTTDFSSVPGVDGSIYN